MRGLTIKHNKNGFCAVRLHYTADPDKDPGTEKGRMWYEQARAAIKIGTQSEKDWEREMEINPNVYDGSPVFPNFDFESDVVDNLTATEESAHPILVGIDAGFRHPAVVVCQYDGQILRTVGEWTPNNITTENLIREIKYQVSFYPRSFKIRYFSGHEARQVDKDSGKNLLDWCSLYGIDLNVADIRNIETGLDLMRSLLSAGKWKISSSCTRLIDALQGGYRYPEIKSTTANDRNPIKDGVHDDIVDAVRAVITQNFTLDGSYIYTEDDERLIAAGLAVDEHGKIIRHPVVAEHLYKPFNVKTGY